MKKMFLLLATTILSCLMAFAKEVEVKVHVSTPGTLEDAIIEAGHRPMFVTKLIVTGSLNDDDFKMIGEKMNELCDIDMAGISNTYIPDIIDYRRFINIVLPNEQTIIEDRCFYYCSILKSITIGNNVTLIGNSAFEGCSSLTSITIPNNVTSIGDCVFKDCSSLFSIEWNAIHCENFSDRSTPFFCNLYDKKYDIRKQITSLKFGNNVEYIPSYLFYGMEGLALIKIPNSVIEIGDRAFFDYDALTSITIPNSVTSIGDEAFSWCSSLTSITIGNGVTNIGSYAFSSCLSLTSITIPNSVKLIGESAFKDCSKLTSVVLSDYITKIPEGLFEGCSALNSLVMSNNITTIGKEAFMDCCSLFNDKITFPSTVNFIGKDAFKGCKLRSIECRSFEPPTATASSFMVNSETCQLIVPKVAYKNYLKHDYWGTFYNITTIDIDYKEVVLTVNNEFVGDVIGGGIYEMGSKIIIAAMPFYFPFVQWSDGNTDNPREIVVDKDIELIAEFYMPPLISTIPEIIEKGYEGEIIIKYNPLAGNGGMKDAFICYAHTGLVTSESNWKYGTAGWRDGDEKYKMTKKDGVWELKIPNIYEFYGCPRSEEILKMAFVFNDGPNGEKEGKTAEGGDIFVDLNSDNDDFYELKAAVVPLRAGEVAGATLYKAGVVATLTARAYDGYRFKQWSDGNTDNPREIVVDKDIELTAEFYMPPLISTVPEKIEKGYEGEIIVIFNQTAGNLGMKDAFICYAHTGLVTPESSWKYGTAGWRDGDEQYKMTKNGVWELKIPNIYEFYGCPRTEEILKMAFVFNDGPNGEKEGKTADGGDIFIELVEASTPVDNVTDEQQMVFVDDNRIYIVGYSGDYQVYNMSGQLVYSGNDSNVELLKGIYVIRMGEKTQKVVL